MARVRVLKARLQVEFRRVPALDFWARPIGNQRFTPEDDDYPRDPTMSKQSQNRYHMTEARFLGVSARVGLARARACRDAFHL